MFRLSQHHAVLHWNFFWPFCHQGLILIIQWLNTVVAAKQLATKITCLGKPLVG